MEEEEEELLSLSVCTCELYFIAGGGFISGLKLLLLSASVTRTIRCRPC